MTSCPSWNGKWSGEGRKYVIVKTFTGVKGGAQAQKIIAEKSYWYSWDDGWCASIRVQEVDGKMAAKLRKESDGFSGYEWMVESILRHGVILADHQVADFLAKQKETECV